MTTCGTGPKGITVNCGPATVAKGSYTHPPCHAYGYEWPQVVGNPPCMELPDPEPSRCPEACPHNEGTQLLSPCSSCLENRTQESECEHSCASPGSGDPCSELSPPPPPPPPQPPSSQQACPSSPPMSQPFPPPPLGPRMLRCHHPSVPSVAPHPKHEPCSLPFPKSCLRIEPIPKSTLTSKNMRAALMPYDHLSSTYQLDFCSPSGQRRRQQHPCGKKAAPLGKSAGLITEYVGKCGGGPRPPPPRRVYGCMGPPPLKYSFGRTEYQSKVGRLGGVLLRCHAKRVCCSNAVVPYGTVRPHRPPLHPPCIPPCAPPPPPPCAAAEKRPCPSVVYFSPCREAKMSRPGRKCFVCK